MTAMEAKTRHILGLSGGKDSTALAVYMRDKVADMEYVFCDTGKELPETYEYLKRVEAFLGKPIVYLNADRDFDHWLAMFGNYLPSAKMRWCTRKLKIAPFEKYVGEGPAYSYIGIRADEDRFGYKPSLSPNGGIIPVYPFKEAGLVKADIHQILEDSGLGFPEYYQWRTRSGCYFCFFQRKIEWVGLLERHPHLFEEAKSYERPDPESGTLYTWSQQESLAELQAPDRVAKIKANQHDLMEEMKSRKKSKRLVDIFEETNDLQDDFGEPCMICHL
jgi:3'-phosphoadenosine 5'-phosphosulfate sulfotransferase (PAPS reductase)/FAD synthetase